MKKIKIALVFVLSACMVCALCLFAACVKKEEQPDVPPTVEKDGLYWSFETLDELYDDFLFAQAFGKVDLNDDAAYVTDGEHSIKICPLGTWNPSLGAPYMSVRLKDISETGVFDFSAIKEIRMDLFNENDAPQTLSVSFVADGITTSSQDFTVEKGANRDLVVPVNVRAMQLTTDMSKTTEMRITFPAADLEQPAGLYYMDNLRVEFYETKPGPYTMDRDGDEICSFDKEYQRYITVPGALGPATGCMPVLSMNDDEQFSKGGSSLKAVFPTGSAPLDDGWPNWSFTEYFLSTIDFKAYADKQAEIVFDVYVPKESGSLMFEAQFKYNPTTDENGNTVNVSGGIHYFTPTPGQWNEIRVPVTTWSKFYKDGKEVDTSIRSIAMSICKFADPDKTFYFDNFRFEVPDLRDVAGFEDFEKKVTDPLISAGWETFVEYPQGKTVSSTGAQPKFYGKFTGGNAHEKWVLCARNPLDTNDLYFEAQSSVFDLAEKGDTLTMSVWAYVWQWDDSRINQCINKNWELEFYKYREDGKYEEAQPVYSYLLGHCGSPKWRDVEIPADAVEILRADQRFAFRINTHNDAQTGAFEYELFIDYIQLNKADKTVAAGTDLAKDLAARFSGCEVTVESITRDGQSYTGGNVLQEAGEYSVTVKVSSEQYAENTFVLKYTVQGG